ncbi:MAG: hypothetical protein AAB456_01595 [Patescibacteria group bacterium]
MKTAYTILGLSPEEWRKAFYGGRISETIDAVAAQDAPSAAELTKLNEYLSTLKNEREGLKKGLEKYRQTDRVNLPSPTELMAIDKNKAAEIKEWEKNRETDYHRARQIFESAKQAKPNTHREQWINWAMELATLQYHLDMYRVWKDQQYRARLVNIIDDFGASRAEAEERAKLTPEYRDYKNAVLFRELTEEVIMLCKKYYSI